MKTWAAALSIALSFPLASMSEAAPAPPAARSATSAPRPTAAQKPGARARPNRGAHEATPAKGRPKPPPPKPDSIGHPNQGHLEGGVRLDTSLPYLRVVPAYVSGDVRWGLPELVHVIERAAKAVARRFPGAVMDVGDLSRRQGGEILRHDSHESGRDVDLGFYAVDGKGKPVKTDKFIRFDASLAAPDVRGARFDLARNWLLVQGLLTDGRAHVSHIFIAEPLRQALLSYARSHGVSRPLLHRAALTLMQPTDSLPHDDHIHVRISCPGSMHDTCIELSKDAPMGRRAVARGKGRDAATPSRGKRAAAARRGAEPRGRTGAAPPRSGAASTAGKSKEAAAPAPPTVATVAAKRAGEGAREAEADASEVRDALDDMGLMKITN